MPDIDVPSDISPRPFFDEQVMTFLADLSRQLLASPEGHLYPDLTAFAFYIRKANLAKLQQIFAGCERRMGRGLCFHIAPSNIPINFAFSWIFSLLAGNANIVRLPSREFSQVDAWMKVATTAMETYTEIKNRNIFVKYPRTDSATTDAYCAMADCRMIWGGNQTIAAMKAIPVKPRCVDINFADRYSLAIINGAAVLAADDIQRFRLAEAFYNDTYLMDQNACSSPQVILWEQDSLEAREKFWNAMLAQAKAKYHLQDATAVDKYTLMCRECIENKALKDIAHTGNLLYRIELNELPQDLVDHRGHGGFFYEYSLKNRKDFFARVTEQFQTITCFGIDPSELCQQVMQAHLTGIDRIVSIGQAMSIGAIWDGHDLLRELSRVIALD